VGNEASQSIWNLKYGTYKNFNKLFEKVLKAKEKNPKFHLNLRHFTQLPENILLCQAFDLYSI